MIYCKNCGKEMDENAVICISCGSEKNAGDKFCWHCGSAVSSGQYACLNCGYPLSKKKLKQKKQNDKKLKMKHIILISIISVLLIASIISIPIVIKHINRVDFKQVFEKHCNITWAKLLDNGDTLYVDTNPFDYEDSGTDYIQAYYALEKINAELGLPESLFEEMGRTSAIDGKQTEEYPSKGIKVKWEYHPDYGLEVSYTKIK